MSFLLKVPGSAAGAGLAGDVDQGDGRQLLPARLAVFGDDGRENAAAYIELGGQTHEAGRRCGDQVIQNQVGHGLVKRPFITEAPHVEFEAFELHTLLIRDVVQNQRGEVGLSGFRTKACKFRDFHVNGEIALRCRVRKRFQGLARLGAHNGFSYVWVSFQLIL